MQRLKNGIVMDIRSGKLSSAMVLSQNYEMLELEIVELQKFGLHIITPADDPEVVDYMADGYKEISRFKANVAVPKRKEVQVCQSNKKSRKIKSCRRFKRNSKRRQKV